MKVLQDTPDRLVIEDRPVLLAGMLLGAILVTACLATGMLVEGSPAGLGVALVSAAFGLAFAVFVERVRVTFDRASGRITVTTASVRRRRTETLPLDIVRQAATQSRRSRSRPGARAATMSRPVLHLAEQPEPRPLMQVYTAGSGAAEAVAAINRWLGKPAAA
jgi:hypothetical protein